MAGMGKMHPYLMGATGKEADLEQAGIAALLGYLDLGARTHPAFAHADPALAAARYIFVQRFADVERLALGHAFDDGGVDLLNLAFAQLPMEFDQRAALLAEDQQAGGVPVKAMGELQKFRLRAAGAQRLDDAVAHPAAAVDGDPGGLVHYQ